VINRTVDIQLFCENTKQHDLAKHCSTANRVMVERKIPIVERFMIVAGRVISGIVLGSFLDC